MTRSKLRPGLAVTGLIVAVGLTMRGERVRACAGGDWDISYETTFDPQIVGEWNGLAFDPSQATFGGRCWECLDKAMLDDWIGFLPGVTAADWKKVLMSATETELDGLKAKATGAAPTPPKGYATSTLWKVTAKDHLTGALDFVKVARKVEGFTMLDAGYPNPPPVPPADLGKLTRAGMANKEPFLAQRYAYQALRVAFYRSEWAEVIKLHDANAAVLAKPSVDIAWNARHYLAGALLRTGALPRANLELARIGAYQPLAGAAAWEFAPKNDADWKAALKLAPTTADKIALWRMVGIRRDGLVGAREILKLDPKSDQVALLVVRELTKLEERRVDRYMDQADPKDLQAQNKAFGAIEAFANDQIKNGGDRPWLMDLIVGHIAAIRGDLTTTRQRIARALAAQPTNKRVRNQANASLAIAISRNWKIDPSVEGELANAVLPLDSSFSRRRSTRDEIRERLSRIYLKAKQPAVAELLWRDAVTRDPDGNPATKRYWRDSNFIRELIQRQTNAKTPWEKFVADSPYSKDELAYELAVRSVFDGDFVYARDHFDPKRSTKLWADPFTVRIADCYECDIKKYTGKELTHKQLFAKLVELDAKVKAGGDAGAQAALQIGAALYTLSDTGVNERTLASRAGPEDEQQAAMKWFKKAYDLATSKELKAQAAYLAAKAELIVRRADGGLDGGNLPLPKTWYPELKKYKTTKYGKEVLKECGRFAAWAN